MLTAGLWVPGLASATDKSFDGRWAGEGRASSGDCPAFDFQVSVIGERVHGKAHQTGTDYRVIGELTEDGVFSGEVEYLWMTIAELKGDLQQHEGRGAWRSLEGPDCVGEFTVRKLGLDSAGD